jgi:ribosomal protein L37AE/L43A
VRTEQEVAARLAGLDDDTANSVCCALLGHSRVQDQFFGQWTCGRCGAIVGDSLAGGYRAADAVCLDHHCDECRANLSKLTWADRYRLSDAAQQYLVDLSDESQSKVIQAENIRKHDELMAQLRAKHG